MSHALDVEVTKTRMESGPVKLVSIVETNTFQAVVSARAMKEIRRGIRE